MLFITLRLVPRRGRLREGIDISVHCDVEIFDWLIRYIKVSRRAPPLVPCLSTSFLPRALNVFLFR